MPTRGSRDGRSSGGSNCKSCDEKGKAVTLWMVIGGWS